MVRAVGDRAATRRGDLASSIGAMDFEVRRNDLRTHRILDGPLTLVAEGQVLLHVGQCALTANNITYGAFGDLMRYWDFFPGEDGWGRVPVWGFADVAESHCDGISDGERVYGYFPMSTHLVVEPTRITPGSFVDASAHRQPLPPVYNQYTRLAVRASEHDEQLHAVLRPLFTTSFLIDDWLADHQSFGAASVVIASASSKTGLSLAALLSARHQVEVVGLTSARNADFVQSVGYYDRVVTYDDVSSLDPTVPTVLVDMGGDAAVLAAVHGHFGDRLLHSCQVGATHWEQVQFGADLPGPTPTMFFAPDHVVRRLADWGGPGFEERVGAAWNTFTESAETWLTIEVHRGPDAVATVFDEVLEGRLSPDRACVIELDAPGAR